MTVEDYDTHVAAEWLWKLVSPVLIVFGNIGNILVIIVLTRRKFKKTTITVFLVSLAFSDILVLNTGLLRQWITHAFGVDIRTDLTESGCKFHWFIVYVTTQHSSWMLICVTIERTISTCLPHKRTLMCTFRKAYITEATIATVLFLLNAHYLFGYGTKVYQSGNATVTERCQPLTSGYEYFITYEWAWLDLCVFYLIPMLVLLSGNSIIAYKVIQSHRKSRAVAPAPEPSMAVVGRETTVEQRQQAVNVTSTKNTKVSSLTITLMLVSVVFIVCITPIVVYPIGDPYWKSGASDSKIAELFLWESLANIIMYVNNSVNCVLYFFSGSKFRDELKRFLCPLKYARSNTTMHSNTLASTAARSAQL